MHRNRTAEKNRFSALKHLSVKKKKIMIQQEKALLEVSSGTKGGVMEGPNQILKRKSNIKMEA